LKRGTDPRELDDAPVGEDDRRDGTRFPLLLTAQCIKRDGKEMQVWLTDISHTGCQIFACAESLTRQESVVVVSYGDECRSGSVAWTEGMKAGVRFDLALPALTIKQLLTAKPSSSRPAERDFDRPVDQFGRKLAPLPRLGRGRRSGV
jgi:hypothetical protein